jgi:GTPase SAR1 family protein/predicted  nucleic acid-binding Zn-ribbon protein
MVIICCAVAVLVGFGLAFLFKPKNNNQLSASDSDRRLADVKAATKTQVLQEQIDNLNKEKYDLQTKLANLESKGNATQSTAQQEQIDSLNQEKADLQNKLAKIESENKDLDKRLQDAQKGKGDASASDEIKKLKKKISDLEEEKEDLEDDFNDKLKKEKRKLEEQKSQIEDDLKKSKRDLDAANEQVRNLQIDLKDAEKSANLKAESLAFVKEVLTAAPTSSGDMNKLYDLIDDIKDIILDQLYPWVTKCFKRPEDPNEHLHDHEKYYFYSVFDWETISRKKWIANKTAIAFVGEFSAGKTSIVNRILSVKLPVSTKATTAIPTYISGGNIEKFQFVSPDNIVKNMPKETFEKINKEVLDEVDGVSAMLKYFVMEYPNSNLKNLSILDTPGFNSNDQEDAQRTIDVINECDALFWVFDVNAGTINKSSIKLIKENLQKPLYVVINKVDTKSDRDVTQVENLIKRTLADNGVEVVQYIRFSQKESPSTLMNVIKNVPRSNNTSGYLDEVMQWVNNMVDTSQQWFNDSANICNESDKQIDEMQEKTNRLAVGVQRNCDDVMGLGHYESNFFRSDMIEFSLSEYDSFKNKVNSIYSGAYELANNFFDYGKAVSENMDKYQEKWSDQNNLNRIIEIQENLSKKIAELNKLK